MTPVEREGREVQYLRRSEFSRLDGPAFNEDPAPAALDLNLKRNLRVYRKQAVTVGVIVALLLIAFGLFLRPKYKAEAAIYVDPIRPGVMPSDFQGQVDAARYLAQIAQLSETMKRPDLLAGAVNKMPAGVWRKPGEPVAAAAARLGAALSVDRQAMSFQLTVSLLDDDARDAPTALNVVIREFMAAQDKIEDANWDIRIKLLGTERENLERELMDTRDRLVQVNTLLGIGSFTPDAKNPMEEQMAALHTQLDNIRRDRDAAVAALASGKGDPTATPDPADVQFEQQIEQRKATLRSQMSGMTALNPLYKQDQDELDGLDKQLSEEHAQSVTRQTERLRDRVRQADAMSSAIQSRLSQESAHLVASAPLLQRAAELTARVRELEGNVHTVDEGERRARLEKEAPSAVRVVTYAASPAARETSKQMLVFAAALPVGLIAAVLAACLLGFVHSRIFGANDVERAVGFSPVAVIPAEGETSEAVRRDYYLRVAASIESAYRRMRAHVFVFTTVGDHADLTILMQGVRQELFDLGYAPLWMDGSSLLSAEREFEEDYGQGAEAARLAGRTGESISGSRLRWLLSNYDMVLIEAEPLLVSALAEYASRASDVTIVVAESGATPTTELKEAVQLLGRLQVPSVGVIVDELKLKNSDTTYRTRLDMAERRMSSDADAPPREKPTPPRPRAEKPLPGEPSRFSLLWHRPS